MAQEQIDINAMLNREAMTRRLEEMVRNGEIYIAMIPGDSISAEELKPVAFTVDRRKYRLRLTDETEESVKVWIEPK